VDSLSGKKSDLRNEAFSLYCQGMKLVDIAKRLNVPAGTVRRWKHSDKWDTGGERSDKANEKSERSDEQKIRRRKRAVADAQSVTENAELTDKQRLFCIYYIRCFNAVKAYQKAYGCSYANACSNASHLMKNTEIRAEIQRLKADRMEQALLQPEDIFQKYMDIAFADVTDFLTFGQKEVPVMGAFGQIMVNDPDTGEKIPLTKIVNAVSFKESDDVDGTIISEVKQGRDGASIKLADRIKALDWLADHMDLATVEQRARVEKLKAEAERIRRDGLPDDDEGVTIINDAPK
jgi:phage terminase small subunit